MGRDHTIFAKEKGYVTYYKDPDLHPKRKYIGVVFERGWKLPMPKTAPRIRRLGLVSREREISTAAVAKAAGAEGREGLEVGGLTEAGGTVVQQDRESRAKVPQVKAMELRPGYQYRDSNWHIGRAAERAGVKVKEYKRGSRFSAWRKINARKARMAERSSSSSRQKKGKARKR